jgi:hypothetical protein
VVKKHRWRSMFSVPDSLQTLEVPFKRKNKNNHREHRGHRDKLRAVRKVLILKKNINRAFSHCPLVISRVLCASVVKIKIIKRRIGT